MSTYKNFIKQLEDSSKLAGRKIDEIELIAVSKKKPATDIQKVGLKIRKNIFLLYSLNQQTVFI